MTLLGGARRELFPGDRPVIAGYNHDGKLVFSVPVESRPDDVEAWLAKPATKEERRACEQAYRAWKPDRDQRLQ